MQKPTFRKHKKSGGVINKETDLIFKLKEGKSKFKKATDGLVVGKWEDDELKPFDSEMAELCEEWGFEYDKDLLNEEEEEVERQSRIASEEVEESEDEEEVEEKVVTEEEEEDVEEEAVKVKQQNVVSKEEVKVKKVVEKNIPENKSNTKLSITEALEVIKQFVEKDLTRDNDQYEELVKENEKLKKKNKELEEKLTNLKKNFLSQF